jgi:hypothetical protein
MTKLTHIACSLLLLRPFSCVASVDQIDLELRLSSSITNPNSSLNQDDNIDYIYSRPPLSTAPQGGLLFGGHMAGKKAWEMDLEKKKTGQLKALAIGSPMLGMHIQLHV